MQKDTKRKPGEGTKTVALPPAKKIPQAEDFVVQPTITGLFVIQLAKGGVPPKYLSGKYTDPDLAQRAISVYLAKFK